MSDTITIKLSSNSKASSQATGDTPKCYCDADSIEFKVKKENNNKGRKFYKCDGSVCKFFKWADRVDEYDPDKFRRGTCHRCGRYNCDSTDCEETWDTFGNVIRD